MRRQGPTRVLIVDDSPLVRSILTRVLAKEGDISVVGGARDPYEARELIIDQRPDVIILDIEMPRMDGITFLRKLVAHYPVPVIMCSSITPSSSRTALEAVEIGAVDVVAKPTDGGTRALASLGAELADKIRAATLARPGPPPRVPTNRHRVLGFAEAGLDPSQHIVAIGASTGGTEAIKKVLEHAPADFPPVVMVQHMPAGFTRSFAERLNQFSKLSVKEAEDNDPLVPGQALLARGGVQMTVRGTAGRWRVAYGSDRPVNRHCPSVDVLFESIAAIRGPQAVGILLTGMGADGAAGLLRMREAGDVTIGQTPETCVVYGMPKVAAELGAVEQSAAPADIPRLLTSMLQQRKRAHAPAGA